MGSGVERKSTVAMSPVALGNLLPLWFQRGLHDQAASAQACVVDVVHQHSCKNPCVEAKGPWEHNCLDIDAADDVLDQLRTDAWGAD